MAQLAPSEDLLCLESEDALTAGALGFMPRILVLTTLPHRRPESHRFERVNKGRHTLRISAPRRVGQPMISGPRGTADRLYEHLDRLLSMRLDWPTPVGFVPRSSGSTIVIAEGPT